MRASLLIMCVATACVVVGCADGDPFCHGDECMGEGSPRPVDTDTLAPEDSAGGPEDTGGGAWCEFM